MKKRKPKKQKSDFRSLKIGFMERTLKFTEKVIVWVTLLYVFNWIVSVILIGMAIKETQNFAYLDTLITETSETFRNVVGIAIIKFGVENIFKYNDFGGKIPSKNSKSSDTIESSIDEPEETIDIEEVHG